MNCRNLTYTEDAICRTQASIYVQVVHDGYDVKSFSDAYLTSNFCQRSMDAEYSRFQIEFPQECLDFIYPEIKEQLRPRDEIVDYEKVYWAGYMYRALQLLTGLSSNKLQRKIPCDKLLSTYSGLHVEDDTLIFEDLCKIFNLQGEA